MNTCALVPSYKRPAYLERCVNALMAQTRPPETVIVVVRDSDQASLAVARRLIAGGLPVVLGTVSRPGHLPPLAAGRELVPADSDVVVIVDDDFMVHRDAFARIAAHFADERVGLVAGHAVEHDEGVPRPAVPGRGGGQVSFAGSIYAGHSHDSDQPGPRATDWAAGLLAAYRADAYRRLEMREELNENVAVGYEVDWGLQVGAMGYRRIYDPGVSGDHHNAPRHHGSARHERSFERVYWQNHNHTFILLNHLRGPRRWIYLANNFLIGRGDWGLGSAANATLRRRDMSWRGVLGAAYRGKVAGVRRYLRSA